MKIAILALFLFPLVIAKEFGDGLHPLSKEMVELINRSNLSWSAHHHFKEEDFDNVKVKLGLILNHNYTADEKTEYNTTVDIPAEFDARTQWPECADIIGDVRDQANCGSCWAFAMTESASDRICIASGGKQKVKISADDLISCCSILSTFSFCGFGCNGGIPILAWRFYKTRGLVSGGNFNETDTCRPYEIEPCGHHTDKNPCKGMHRTPKCKKSCVNNANYKQDKHYATKYYKVKSSVEAIQREIMEHGSVTAGFSVYSDFPNYKDGVYESQGGSMLGGHAVKIMGWGEENGKPYWLILNSWNTDWGMNGYFKMIRGKNHCGIESSISAGLPKL